MSDLKNEFKDIIIKLGKYLFNHQVITEDLSFSLNEGEEIGLAFAFIRKDPGPYNIQIRKRENQIYIRTSKYFEWYGPLENEKYIRIVPNGKISESYEGEGGITFFYTRFNDDQLRLEAIDNGGIWEEYLNYEALFYDPQVAGTYYADAYSAYIFGWLAKEGYGTEYYNAAKLALDFVMRVYPEYKPMRLDAFGHTDFKNPVFIETVEEYMLDWADNKDIAKWRTFYEEMINTEGYSPTNVYALRYFWWSVRNKYLDDPSKKNSKEPLQYFQKVKNDVTPNGLIQDNFYSEDFYGGYYDSYDLTYHIYALSWLVRGFNYLPSEEIWNIIKKGAEFSLTLTTSGGECSYIGRSANNIYHPISAIYSFLYIASKEKILAKKLYRAVHLIFNYIIGYQLSEGNFPSCLNDYADELIGWSHCQTPYNATTGYFLIQSLPLIPFEMQEEKLTLETPNQVDYKESRYGAISNRKLYVVMFSGSDISPYPHSGIHNTGIAGIAALGLQGNPSIFPILEQSLREKEWSTSDLPDIIDNNNNIMVPVGRGTLTFENTNRIAIDISYGGFNVIQKYTVEKNKILIKTILNCKNSGNYQLFGAPGISLRIDKGHFFKVKNNKIIHYSPNQKLIMEVKNTPFQTVEWKVTENSTTGRGFHQKVGWFASKNFQKGESLSYSTILILKKYKYNLFKKKKPKSVKKSRTLRVPSFILRRVYQKGSLKNTDKGLSFVIKNDLVSVTITDFNFLQIGEENFSESVSLITDNFKTLMQDISENSPIRLNKGQKIEVFIKNKKLPVGEHKIIISINTKEVGPLRITVSDNISD